MSAATTGAAVAWQNRHTLARLGVGAIAAVVAVLMLVVAPLAILDRSSGEINGAGLPAGAQPFLAMYSDAGAVHSVSPFVLMAIHENETHFSETSSVGVATGVNFAGCCAGPMQFSITGGATPEVGGAGGTWAAFRMGFCNAKLSRPRSYPNRFTSQPGRRAGKCRATTGSRRGEYATPNVYDSFDAIYAAAAYLKYLKAGPELDERTHTALVSYTGEAGRGSTPIADKDFARAKEFEQLASAAPGYGGPVPTVPGQKARLLPNGLAAAPEKAPPEVKRMIGAANAISDTPYVYGGGHGPTHINQPAYDCSSSTTHMLWAGGVFGESAWTSGLLMAYGRPGHGKWVSIYTNTGHVFSYVAGLRFDTSSGYDDGPNAGESGPRWRTGPRPLTGFVLRHPAGL